jgi:hypothetical protein
LRDSVLIFRRHSAQLPSCLQVALGWTFALEKALCKRRLLQ